MPPRHRVRRRIRVVETQSSSGPPVQGSVSRQNSTPQTPGPYPQTRGPCASASTSGWGLVSRVTPVHTAVRSCTRDEGGPFEVSNQVWISSHRKLLWSKATVVNVAEKSEREFDRYG